MVAVIKSSSSINNTLYYNENKVKQKAADLIHSSGFVKDTELLTLNDKLKCFKKLTQLNQQTKLNSVHISLNFDPSEKLSVDILTQIADTYMDRIGFGNQPYLVYQHNDSGHPHIHIVTTNIQRNGKRISMQNIGRNQSEKARKEIEFEFKLVQADTHKLKQAYQLNAFNSQKVLYGKADTKRSITNVLDVVLSKYKYSSLAELNAVLQGYNIVADRGSKDSRTYKNDGLVYRILNDKQEKIGVPIKASAIYNNPGIKFLNKKFSQNKPLKEPFMVRPKNAIDHYFLQNNTPSLTALISALQKERIQVVVRKNDLGVIYGMTYVDHQNKCVFNGSELGKPYASNAILERCEHKQNIGKDQLIKPESKITGEVQHKNLKTNEQQLNSTEPSNTTDTSLLKELMKSAYEGSLATELLTENTKKKKRKLRNS